MRGKLQTAAGVAAAAARGRRARRPAQGGLRGLRPRPGHARAGRGSDAEVRSSSTATPTTRTESRRRSRRGMFRLPAGTRIDTNAVAKCTATDEELRAQGRRRPAPRARKVGAGTLTAVTGFGPPADPVAGEVTVFNGDGQLIELVTVPDTDRSAGFDRLTHRRQHAHRAPAHHAGRPARRPHRGQGDPARRRPGGLRHRAADVRPRRLGLQRVVRVRRTAARSKSAAHAALHGGAARRWR